MIKTRIKDKSIVAISDTHGFHRDLKIRYCDILICCGDICTDGNEKEIEDFFKWFSSQPSHHKVFCNGNHDLIFELEPDQAEAIIPENVIFIKNESKEITDGLVFHHYDSHDFIDCVNQEKVNILINHIPPKGYLDNSRGSHFQTEILKENKFDFGFFGHVHECFGEDLIRNTTLFNCSSYNYITAPSLTQSIFRERPEQWGLRGDKEMWYYLEWKSASGNPKAENLITWIKGIFVDYILKEGLIRDNEMVYFESFDQSGMSGGNIYLPWWKETGFPLLEERLSKFTK